MTQGKDRKRVIRDRMKKTGESYTAARAQVLTKAAAAAPALPASATSPAPALAPAPAPAPASGSATIDHAALAGMSDIKISEKTGRTWQEWVRVLDAEGASICRIVTLP